MCCIKLLFCTLEPYQHLLSLLLSYTFPGNSLLPNQSNMSIEAGSAKSMISSNFKLGDETPLPSINDRQFCPVALDMKPAHDYYQAVLAEKTRQLRVQNTIIHNLCIRLHKANLDFAHLSKQTLHDKLRLQTSSDQEEIHRRRIEELEEENEAHLDTINALIATERKQQDTILSAEAQALVFIRGAWNCGWVGLAMLNTLSIKYMGAICCEEWKRAYKQQFGHKAEWRLRCEADLIVWQDHIQNSEWHPFKIVEVDGTAASFIDEDDLLLKDLFGFRGRHLYAIVVKALKEMETYNASGRYPTPVLWDSGRMELVELPGFISKLSENFVVLNELVETDLRQQNRIILADPSFVNP